MRILFQDIFRIYKKELYVFKALLGIALLTCW